MSYLRRGRGYQNFPLPDRSLRIRRKKKKNYSRRRGGGAFTKQKEKSHPFKGRLD